MPGPERVTPRLQVIDGLRGCCAIMIVMLHMPSHGPLFGAAFVRSFYLFVDFFFVLSGFVIGRAYAARLAAGLPLRHFLWKRLAALYPLYLLMLGGFVALNLGGALLGLRGDGRGAFTAPDDLVHLLISAAMLQSFCGGSALIWNVPGWSVAVEMIIYLLGGGLMRLAGRGLPWMMSALLAVSLAALLAAPGGTIAQFGPQALARCGYGFAIGYFAYRAEPHILPGLAMLPRRAATAAEMLAVLCVLMFLGRYGLTRASLAAPPIFAGLILIFAAARGAVAGLASSRFPVMVGRWSYALYISHFLFTQRLIRPLLERGLPTTWPHHALIGDAVALASIPLLVATAGMLTRFVQQPAQSALERMWVRDTPGVPRRAARLDVRTT